jgi:XrtJ-associated TM-motif-TM protein
MHRKSIPTLILVAASIFVLGTKSAFGFITGCTDSPEDPTVVLALLGCGAVAVPAIRAKFRSRKLNK